VIKMVNIVMCCSRQALTDGFHFHDDILSCLHSFPLELVSRLRRPMSQCCTVLDPSAELGCVNRDSVDAAVNDLPPESSSCDMECSKLGDECVTHSEPVEDCSITMNSASNNESVDMTDCKTVSFIFILLLLLVMIGFRFSLFNIISRCCLMQNVFLMHHY